MKVCTLRHIKDVIQNSKAIEYYFFFLLGIKSKTLTVYKNAEWKAHIISKWPVIFFYVSFASNLAITNLVFLVGDIKRGEIDISNWYILHYLR